MTRTNVMLTRPALELEFEVSDITPAEAALLEADIFLVSEKLKKTLSCISRLDFRLG